MRRSLFKFIKTVLYALFIVVAAATVGALLSLALVHFYAKYECGERPYTTSYTFEQGCMPAPLRFN